MRLTLSLAAAVLGLWIAADTARAAHPATKPPAYWHARVVKAKRTLAAARRYERLSREIRGTGPAAFRIATQVVFGPLASRAYAIAVCESGASAYARNGDYWGGFQVSSYWRGRFGHEWNALAQTQVAWRVYRVSGGFGPWECA